MEKEASIKHFHDELEAKNKQVGLLEKQVKELEEKLQLLDAKSKEKGEVEIPTILKDGKEVKSREIESAISTTSKRKSKKKPDSMSAQTLSSSAVNAKTAEGSAAMNYKFILGLALVSVVIGIILGKSY